MGRIACSLVLPQSLCFKVVCLFFCFFFCLVCVSSKFPSLLWKPQSAKGCTITECLWDSFLPGRGSLVNLRVDTFPLCVCVRAWDGTVLDTLQAAVGAGFGQAGAPGSSECVWSPQLSITASCSSGDLSRTSCLAVLMCQAGLHEALFRIDLGVMPWHSWPFILELCHSMSHLCMASAALRLSAGISVLKNCLCFSVSPVSFLLSLLTCNVLKSS